MGAAFSTDTDIFDLVRGGCGRLTEKLEGYALGVVLLFARSAIVE